MRLFHNRSVDSSNIGIFIATMPWREKRMNSSNLGVGASCWNRSATVCFLGFLPVGRGLNQQQFQSQCSFYIPGSKPLGLTNASDCIEISEYCS